VPVAVLLFLALLCFAFALFLTSVGSLAAMLRACLRRCGLKLTGVRAPRTA
jgi:hypothetical protein